MSKQTTALRMREWLIEEVAYLIFKLHSVGDTLEEAALTHQKINHGDGWTIDGPLTFSDEPVAAHERDNWARYHNLHLSEEDFRRAVKLAKDWSDGNFYARLDLTG